MTLNTFPGSHFHTKIRPVRTAVDLAMMFALIVVAAPSANAQARSDSGHGILQASELETMQNGTVRSDLNAFRLNPSLLDQKAVMQYFIGLNNCHSRDIGRALQNELDYPALATFYKSKAAEILSALPNTIGVAMFRGNTKGAQIWGKSIGGWDATLKTLSLGQYDVNRKVFPILVSDKSKSFQVSGVQELEVNRQSLERTCPVAYDAMMRSPESNASLPSRYSVSINPQSYSEMPMTEADARKYIERANGPQRDVFLGVDVHIIGVITGLSGKSSAKQVEFTGDIARIIVFSSGSNQIVGTLYDDGSLKPPPDETAPALTATKSPGEFRMEISTVVFVALSADSCGWPLTSEQRANLKRYMQNIDTYGKFNDKYDLNSEIGRDRATIDANRLNYCENPAQRQVYDRRAATIWPSGPVAAPAGK